MQDELLNPAWDVFARIRSELMVYGAIERERDQMLANFGDELQLELDRYLNQMSEFDS